MYKASSIDCASSLAKSRCTQAPRRGLARHLYEDALNRMQERVTPEVIETAPMHGGTSIRDNQIPDMDILVC